MPRILGCSKNDSQICGGRGDWIESFEGVGNEAVFLTNRAVGKEW
jgi:hypothetical protein